MAKLKPRALGRPALLTNERKPMQTFWLAPAIVGALPKNTKPFEIRATDEGDFWRGWRTSGKFIVTATDWAKNIWRLATKEEIEDPRKRDTTPAPPPPSEPPPIVNGHAKNGKSDRQRQPQPAGAAGGG